jgi:SAM-dependent methyltransferase
MEYDDDPISIKYYVKRYILRHPEQFAGKVIVDAPAGSGSTTQTLREIGAAVYAYDLFPEYFKVEGLTCERFNMAEGLPIADECVDVLFCQEGIEHFSDQYRALQEFNRVLKPGASLFLTTPNYSNLQSRLSYFLFETEYHLKTMPPNEVDSIWMKDESRTSEIYLGHLFLLGIQKLRLLATLAGFRIRQLIFTSASVTSCCLLPLAFPLLVVTNWWTYLNQVRRDRHIPTKQHQLVYREQMRLNTDVRLLIGKHLFIEFEKIADPAEVRKSLQPRHTTFDIIT